MSEQHTSDVIEIETAGDQSGWTYDKPIARKTSIYMTKYEYTRLIAARALQISAGGENGRPRVKTEGIYDPMAIARLEIHQRAVPLVIQRTLPDGTVETWNAKEMNIRDY